MTLVNILFLTIALFGLLTLSSGTWIFQMSLSGKRVATEGARRLAEAACQAAVARLIKAPDTTLAKLQSPLDSYPQGEALLAMDATEAAALQIPVSVNNLKSMGSKPGWGGTVVQPQTANLVGVGRYRGSEVKVEVVLHVPAYPYVIGSSVPLKALDGLKVFGIRNPSALAAGFANIPPDEIEPGHIVTNAPDPSPGNPALELLGSGTRIQGDAQSRGDVKVGAGATVTGELRPMADLAPLPAIDVTSLDTAGRPGLNTLSASSLSNPSLSGFNRRNGDLSVTGGLDLQGGILYIDGTLTVNGGIKGTGAILATGGVRVDGGGVLTGNNAAAIIAKGPVTLQGVPGVQAEYRGMVYTEGNLDCRHANIAGAVVVNNPSPTGSAVLEQVTMAQSSQLANISIPVVTTIPGTPGTGGPGTWPVTEHMNVNGGDRFGVGLTPVMTTDPATGASVPMVLTANMNGPNPNAGYSSPPPGFPVTHPATAAEPWIEIGMPSPMPADPITLGSIRINNLDPSAPADSVDTNYNMAYQNAYEEYTDFASASAALKAAAIRWGASNPDNVDAFLNWAANDYATVKLPQIIAAWNANSRYNGQNPSGGGGGGGTSTQRITTMWTLDLSQFSNLSERIRVQSWREI